MLVEKTYCVNTPLRICVSIKHLRNKILCNYFMAFLFDTRVFLKRDTAMPTRIPGQAIAKIHVIDEIIHGL